MPLDWPSQEGVIIPALAAGKRLPIIEAANDDTADELGNVFSVDTSGLADQPLRNAAALNRQVAEARTEATLRGYHTRLVRCIAFQTGVADYQAVSQVARGQALRNMEHGKGADRTYEHLLPEWRMIADAIGVDEVRALVRACIAAIGDDLVPEAERGTVVGVLKKICHRHGRPAFEAATKLKYTTLDRRVTSGNLGTFQDNFGAVVAMLRLEEREENARLAKTREPASEPPKEKDLAEYWEHDWVKAICAAWLADTAKQLRADRLPGGGKRVMLCEKLKMLAGFSGSQQHEGALRTTFKIPGAAARTLAGNEIIEEQHVLTILRVLVEGRHIPQQAADDFLAEWRAGVAETAETAEVPLGEELEAALTAKGIDFTALAMALDIRGRRPEEASPVSLTKDSVRELRVNDAVSMHAVACLARANGGGVDADIRRFLADVKSRPKVNGRQFTSEWAFMTQFALKPSDLPPPHDSAEIQQYAGASTRPSNPALVSAILNAGWARSAKAVERWLKFHEPQTVRDMATDLHAKVGGAPLVANVKVSTKDTLPRIQAGTEVPTLATVRQMVTDGGAVVGNALLQDWYVRRAELADQGDDKHLVRALDVFTAARTTSISALVDEGAKTVTDAGSADTVRKTALKLTRGEQVADAPFESVLKMTKVAAPNDPTGLFLRALREGSLPAALNDYCRRLAAADRMDVVRLLLDARTEAAPRQPEELPPNRRLEAAMLRKESVVARRAGGADEPRSALLQALMLAPGLLPKDLLAWKPEFAAPVAGAEPAVKEVVRPEKKVAERGGAESVVREVVQDPDEALRETVFGALYERVPPEYRQFWDGLVKDAKLNEMFGYHVKKKNSRDAAALERLMWTSLHMAIRKTERK